MTRPTFQVGDSVRPQGRGEIKHHFLMLPSPNSVQPGLTGAVSWITVVASGHQTLGI